MPNTQTRRRFVALLSAAGVAGLAGGRLARAAGGALETTKVRLFKTLAVCLAPQYVAEGLLRAEGFTEVQYVDSSTMNIPGAIAAGEYDFGLDLVTDHILAMDQGAAITLLAGVHVGCYELFARDEVRSITELKGKAVAVYPGYWPQYAFLALAAAHVGLDPNKDIRWIASTEPVQLFVDGTTDAFLGLPPLTQELRARRFGHVLFSTAEDHPWSQYFCCMLAGNRDYVRNYPVATKRVLRAILKAADLCANEPALVARRIVDAGFAARYDYALQALQEIHYDRWRDYDAEDSVRFYALRLRDVGLIKSSPQKIIAEGADWRFFDELKRELKA
jgi:NitT/TauT family transport system substrate-binding protein